MEKFTIVDPVVVRFENPLDFFNSLIDIFKVMLPGEMDAESISLIEGTQRYEVHLNTAYLGYLYVLAEFVGIII